MDFRITEEQELMVQAIEEMVGNLKRARML